MAAKRPLPPPLVGDYEWSGFTSESSASFPSLNDDDPTASDESVGARAPARARLSLSQASESVAPAAAPPPQHRPTAASARQRGRRHAVRPQRGGGSGAIEEERADAREAAGHVARCAVCWEQQEHDDSFADVADSARRSELAETTRRFRSIIFAFERRLRGRAHDDIIFEGMLTLRRAFVERLLREHNERYRVWTLDMLRRHYASPGGHTIDAVRVLRAELDELGHVETMLMKHALFVSAPAGDDPLSEPGESLFNVRAVETRMRLAKHRADLLKQLQHELANPDDVDARTILESVADVQRRLGDRHAAAASTMSAASSRAVEQRYDVGGWQASSDGDIS